MRYCKGALGGWREEKTGLNVGGWVGGSTYS